MIKKRFGGLQEPSGSACWPRYKKVHRPSDELAKCLGMVRKLETMNCGNGSRTAEVSGAMGEGDGSWEEVDFRDKN